MNKAFIGVGSNLGDRIENCRRAIEQLISREDIRLVNQSSFYETEPLGDSPHSGAVPRRRSKRATAPWYINVAVQVETSLTRYELFQALQAIEQEMGRKRRKKWEPRIIDLDLLFYNCAMLQSHLLTVPHPGIQHRRFVLEPMSEIAPEYVHPMLKKTIKELLAGLDSRLITRKVD